MKLIAMLLLFLGNLLMPCDHSQYWITPGKGLGGYAFEIDHYTCIQCGKEWKPK